MSLAVTLSRAQEGVAAPQVMVEVHLSGGLPSTHIVGLPEAAVREARDRVRVAILSAAFEYPNRKVTVNLAPAELPKDGGRFDLAIALGILAAGNQVLMLEYAIYSVISPEGCASILWRDAAHAEEAAEALCLTAQDLLRLDIVDQIVAEPLGGAHRLPEEAIRRLGEAIEGALRPLLERDGARLREERRAKFLAMGAHGL